MASYPPYIPPRDALFDTWLANFDAEAALNGPTYNFDVAEVAAIAGVNTTWQAAYALAITPATRTAPTVAAKDVARASAEAVVRPLAVRASQDSSIADIDKVTLGVTVPSLVPTPIPAPLIAPVINLNAATLLEMNLGYSAAGAVGKSKPFGSIGMEVYRAIGVVAATDPTQATFNGIVTKSPFQQSFLAADQGKICTFFTRFNTRSGPGGNSQPGPWSNVLNVNIV